MRRFEVMRFETVAGFPTAVERRMSNLKKGTHTDLSFSEVAYDLKLAAKDFSERLLKSPPREYTR